MKCNSKSIGGRILSILFVIFLTTCGSSSEDGGNNNSNNSGSIGSTYEVYGGDTYLTGTDGYNPEKHGYTLLGTASCTQIFSGKYNYYIIVTRPVNIAYVDTVQGSNGIYYSTNTTGNTTDYTNVGGVPDGKSAAVGSLYDGSEGGFIVIDASGNSLSYIVVYVSQLCNGSGQSTEWFEDWDTATVGVKPDNDFFQADTGDWLTNILEVPHDCNYVEIRHGNSVRLFAQASGSIVKCSLSSTYTLVLHHRQQNPILMTKDTLFSGNWNFYPDVNAGLLNYEIEGVIEIWISSAKFILRYVHNKSISGPDGYCSNNGQPYSHKCINISDDFERNIYNDFVSQYGDEFIQWYAISSSSFRFFSISINNFAHIEICGLLDNPYEGDCEYYTSATIDVDYLKLWEKN